MAGTASGSVGEVEAPKTANGHHIQVYGHVDLDSTATPTAHQVLLPASGSGAVDVGPLAENGVYEFTFFADTAGAPTSGTTPPDVFVSPFAASGGTVTNTTTFPYPASSKIPLRLHLIHDESGNAQRYVRFLNMSAATAAVIGVRRLR